MTDDSKAIEFDSNNGQAYYSKGLLHHFMNEDKEAYKDFTKAKELKIANADDPIKKYCN
jgi:hypothetical protein